MSPRSIDAAARVLPLLRECGELDLSQLRLALGVSAVELDTLLKELLRYGYIERVHHANGLRYRQPHGRNERTVCGLQMEVALLLRARGAQLSRQIVDALAPRSEKSVRNAVAKLMARGLVRRVHMPGLHRALYAMADEQTSGFDVAHALAAAEAPVETTTPAVSEAGANDAGAPLFALPPPQPEDLAYRLAELCSVAEDLAEDCRAAGVRPDVIDDIASATRTLLRAAHAYPRRNAA